MDLVFTASAPFQIINGIIGFVSVFMIDFRQIVWIFKEAFGNKPMNIPCISFAIPHDLYLLISVAVISYPCGLHCISNKNFTIRRNKEQRTTF